MDRRQSNMANEIAPRVTIVLHSGAYDRVQYALSIALVSLAMGMEVHMMCTYGGLLRLVKGRTDELGDETGADVRDTLRKGLESGAVQPLSASLRDAVDMGLKLYACVGAMGNLNVSRDELIDEVAATTGLAHFLGLAKDARITLYI